MNDQLRFLTLTVFVGIALAGLLMFLTNPSNATPVFTECGVNTEC